jgi:hypothetical protein
VRCPRCGNENSEENRFCGMCGTKLLGAPAVVASTPVAVAASSGESTGSRLGTSPAPTAPVPTRPQVVATPRSAASVSQDSPGISGPSFLGLNDPPPRQRGLSADSQSSSSLDYLLEDEEPKRGGAGKFALILLMLALAAGFGYLRWKWLVGTSKRPAVTSQAPDPSATTYDVPSSGNPTGTSTPPAPTPTQPPAPAAQPAPDSSSANNLTAASPVATPDAADSSSAKPDAAAPSDASNSSPESSATNQPAAKEADTEPAAATPDAPPPAAPRPKKAAAEAQPKPTAGITPTRSADAVTEAQKYIYGRGVTQDCERGMRLLKPAAAQANPKAMIEMGALYSAGLCTPHDLPTAYRWFAMALRKDPDNQSVQADLQKLWGEMTQPERQLAIRLSQ